MGTEAQTSGAGPDTLPETDDASCKAALTGSGSGSGSAPEPTPEPSLPALTPQEFRIYNRLAEQMDYFVHTPLSFLPPFPKLTTPPQHDHFRQMYSTLQTACATNRRPANLTLKQFIDEGLRLARYLEMHHSIEETHLYPLLGRKMPEFRSTAPPSGLSKGGKAAKKKEDCELLRQHRMIHEGVDEMAEYLRRCKERECELELGVLKGKVEPWGEVLLKHLDQEVRDLGADRMRRFWTPQEMKSFPM